MLYLVAGLITQLCVLSSLLYLFVPLDEKAVADSCPWNGTEGAARGLLVVSQGLGAVASQLRGGVRFERSLVQSDELYPLLAGIPDHVVFSHADPPDSLLFGVDVLVYGGPEGLIDRFRATAQILAFTYPKSCMSGERFLECDKQVLVRVHEMLYAAEHNATLSRMLDKKVLFLLYLTSVSLVRLRKPNNSSAIQENTDLVREGVSSLLLHIEQYYGLDSNTVAVSVPQWSILKDNFPFLTVSGHPGDEGFASSIDLVDLCPLLATLLGVRIPSESVGRLPLSYLNMSSEDEAKALACNAIQLHQRVFSYELTKLDPNILRNVEQVDRRQYKESKQLSNEVILNCLSQLYRSPNRFDTTIFSLAVFCLTGWILFLATEPMAASSSNFKLSTKPFLVITTAFLSIGLTQYLYVSIFWTRTLPYLVYMPLSLVPWFLFLTRYKVVWDWLSSRAKLQTLLFILSMFLLEEIIVFSFEHDFVLIFLITAIGSLPLLPRFRRTPFVYTMGWYTCCCIIIGLLNVPSMMITARTKLINGAATFWLCYTQGSVFYFDFKYDSIIAQVLVFYLMISTILANAYAALAAVPSFFQYMSWLTFSSLIFPLLSTRQVARRLILVSLSFGPPLMLLSTHVESASIGVLGIFVAFWVFLERSYRSSNGDSSWDDIRRGFLLVTSCVIGYLLSGRLQDHDPAVLLSPLFQFHLFWNRPFPYFGVLFFKYLAAFTVVLTVYVSLIVSKWRSDVGYVWGLLLVELICLRRLLQFYFVCSDISQLILEHIFINMFAVGYIIAYWWASIYTTRYVKEAATDCNDLPMMQLSLH